MNVRSNSQLLVAVALNFNAFSQLARASIDLYTIMQELFESGSVKDTIVGWSREVDHEFMLSGSRGLA
jgi:hypothetical protein